jgi:multicomponent Na+:H+ antiporter subunit D
MLASATVLMALGLALGALPGLADATTREAARFTDRASRAALVLHGRALPEPSISPTHVGGASALGAFAAAAGAIAMAALALLGPSERIDRALSRVLAWPRALQSGHVGDYVTWMVVGTTILGGALLALLR